MAEKWLPRGELTGSGLPILLPSEVDCSSQSSAELICEEDSSFVPLKFSSVTLTTHRLIFIQDQNSSSSSSSLSSFALPLASVVHIFPLKKSIKSMFASPRIRLQVSVTYDGMASENGSRSIVLTLVLRGKTDPDVFFERLIEVMRSRAWERDSASSAQVTTLSGRMEFREADVARASRGMRMAGVSGILRKEQEMWESTDRSLQEAFQDLNALMSKAKEMVLLAERMRQKLLSGPNSQSGMANDEEMGSKQEMQDWLLSVGIVSPVTKESAGALYHQQLSRQLADFVKVPLERSGGMIAVIDVYCLFNRARGTELISPEDLLQACAIWEKIDVHVMLRKFESGVMVVQNKSHRDEEVFERIQTLASKPDALRLGVSSSDAAIALGIAPALAKEHLLAAESKGFLARDISPEGFRFYVNLFKDITASNIFSIKDNGLYSAWISASSN